MMENGDWKEFSVSIANVFERCLRFGNSRQHRQPDCSISHLNPACNWKHSPGGLSMKMLFGVGLVVLVLGIVSFFVPVPQRENHGIKVGDASIGVQTQHSEKISPIISA